MERTDYLKQIDAVIEKGPFKDNWDSLSDYQVPKWYENAKFGIFIHWGVYSVPAFGSEWYSRNMYIQGSDEFKHHIETYGNHKDFGYKDFIPMFTADKFDAQEWADLFQKSGAKYVVPVAEHHDGFQMYKSELSHWNAYEMGPKRDILGELSDAFCERNIENGASSHRIEHWFFMGRGKEFDSDIKEPMQCGDFYWPAMLEPNHQELFSQPEPSVEFMEDWLLRTCEIIDQYRPKILYFDWWIQHSALKPYLKKLAAYYYNRADEWGIGVAINYKHDAFQFNCAVPDIERGQFSDAKPFFWQTDTSVAKNSWCYTENNSYKKAENILCDLVDIVSKNGTLLLNIGPKADGSIPEEDKAILLEIGKWLAINGEAIYNTKVWRVCSEGPTKIEDGHFTDSVDKVFTSEDIRYTINGSYLYATVLNLSQGGRVKLHALGDKNATSVHHFHGIIKDVQALGFDDTLHFIRTEDSLEIDATNIKSDSPVVFKILVD